MIEKIWPECFFLLGALSTMPVTPKIITFSVVGDPYKSSFATDTGRGPYPI